MGSNIMHQPTPQNTRTKVLLKNKLCITTVWCEVLLVAHRAILLALNSLFAQNFRS